MKGKLHLKKSGPFRKMLVVLLRMNDITSIVTSDRDICQFFCQPRKQFRCHDVVIVKNLAYQSLTQRPHGALSCSFYSTLHLR